MTTANSDAPKRALYTQQRLLFMALDPIHIGAGGYRLGRVDMTIAREPGTDLPKIPGTSLAGAARSYAAMRYGKPDVAGQQKNFYKYARNGKNNLCPIIYTFGTATDASGGQAQDGVNLAGTVSIGDAHILFFPVSSMAGPVWISTKERIEETWGQQSVTLPENLSPTGDLIVTSLNWQQNLNLGWLLFECKQGLSINPPTAVSELQGLEWNSIKGRIVLVEPSFFSQIVNSNLEVRTSVSINPDTGAAEPGALFTYEAIPRATWLWTDVIEDDYKYDDNGRSLFPETTRQCKVTKVREEKNGRMEVKEVTYQDNEGDELHDTWGRPLDVVRAGMELIEYLGVGGMGTRGFGRMHLVTHWDILNGGAQ